MAGARCVRDALATFDCFTNLSSNYFGPDCQFKGVECQNGIWAARYRVKFYLLKGNDENKTVHEVWARVWERLHAAGIEWTIPSDGSVIEHEMLPAPPSVQLA